MAECRFCILERVWLSVTYYMDLFIALKRQMQVLGFSVQEDPCLLSVWYIYIYISDFVFQKQSCQMLLNQLREITGIQDPSFLHEALKVGFSSQFSWQALKQFPHRCVRSGYLYTRPEHRKSPTGQIRLVCSTEKLQEDGGNLQLGKPVEIHHPCTLYRPYMDPVCIPQTKEYSSREIGRSSGMTVLFLSIVGYNL